MSSGNPGDKSKKQDGQEVASPGRAIVGCGGAGLAMFERSLRKAGLAIQTLVSIQGLNGQIWLNRAWILVWRAGGRGCDARG